MTRERCERPENTDRGAGSFAALAVDRRQFVKSSAALVGRIDALAGTLPAAPAAVSAAASSAGAAFLAALDSAGSFFMDAFLPSYAFDLVPDGIREQLRSDTYLGGSPRSLSFSDFGTSAPEIADRVRADFKTRVFDKCRAAIAASHNVKKLAAEAGLDLAEVGRLAAERDRTLDQPYWDHWLSDSVRRPHEVDLAVRRAAVLESELQSVFDRAGFNDIRAGHFYEGTLFQCFNRGQPMRLDVLNPSGLLSSVYREMNEVQAFFARHLGHAGFDLSELETLARTLRRYFNEDFCELKIELAPPSRIVWSSAKWVDHERAWANSYTDDN